MKNFATIIFAFALASLMCWSLLEAWDREEEIRDQQIQQHHRMLLEPRHQQEAERLVGIRP